MKTIYCVEDDKAIRELMVYALIKAGFNAYGFVDHEEFFSHLESEKPDLVVLDIMLPGLNGLEILKRLKDDEETKKLPVIIASAKGGEYDKVIGLESGADDYLAKPFGMMELISRINAVLRRVMPSDSNSILTLGNIKLDESEHSVFVDNEEIELTNKEFLLLALFMRNPGRVYSRERLLELVWNLDAHSDTRTVDVHVGTLRQKIKSGADYIETIRGVGYKGKKE